MPRICKDCGNYVHLYHDCTPKPAVFESSPASAGYGAEVLRRMDPRKCIRQAEKHRQRMNAALAPLNNKLTEFFNDENALVFYQIGDGWCLLFDDDRNTPVGDVDFDELFQMTPEDAIKYLTRREV